MEMSRSFTCYHQGFKYLMSGSYHIDGFHIEIIGYQKIYLIYEPKSGLYNDIFADLSFIGSIFITMATFFMKKGSLSTTKIVKL